MSDIQKAREEAREKAEVMLAFADGKTIQGRNRQQKEWSDLIHPSWHWSTIEFRVKPKEPRRANVMYQLNEPDPWGFAYPLRRQGMGNVPMLELTPEVIAALRDAGISYEDSEERIQSIR